MVEYVVKATIEKEGKIKFQYKVGICKEIKNIETQFLDQTKFNKFKNNVEEYNNFLKKMGEYVKKIEEDFKNEGVGSTLEFKFNMPMKKIADKEKIKND